jgi:hypothetical protein
MGTLHTTLIYCARAYWGLAVVYAVFPFVFGERVGSTVFTVAFFGAGVLVFLGLLLYGSSRRARHEPEGTLSRHLLRWVAGVAWVAFSMAALAAVGVIVERLIK